jgi:hypothetical protein
MSLLKTTAKHIIGYSHCTAYALTATLLCPHMTINNRVNSSLLIGLLIFWSPYLTNHINKCVSSN